MTMTALHRFGAATRLVHGLSLFRARTFGWHAPSLGAIHPSLFMKNAFFRIVAGMPRATGRIWRVHCLCLYVAIWR